VHRHPWHGQHYIISQFIHTGIGIVPFRDTFTIEMGEKVDQVEILKKEGT
jgi:hypothetical protein